MAKKGTLFGKPRDQVVKKPGAFAAKAADAGMSTAAMITKSLAAHSQASPATKKQAGLAKAFATMRGKKKRKPAWATGPSGKAGGGCVSA